MPSFLLAAVRRWGPRAVAAALTFLAGFMIRERLGEADPVPASFHDFRVNHPEEYSSLVVPGSPEVQSLARRLASPEAAYRFVRDEIAFDTRCAASGPGEILRSRRASCLGKATLLASLYRALGLPAENVRVVVGQVPLGGGLLDHAWVDLEYGPVCLQQDPTDLLGVHDFQRFRDQEYVRAFVQRELFCFNDEGFAAVSQLNRLRRRP